MRRKEVNVMKKLLILVLVLLVLLTAVVPRSLLITAGFGRQSKMGR